MENADNTVRRNLARAKQRDERLKLAGSKVSRGLRAAATGRYLSGRTGRYVSRKTSGG